LPWHVSGKNLPTRRVKEDQSNHKKDRGRTIEGREGRADKGGKEPSVKRRWQLRGIGGYTTQLDKLVEVKISHSEKKQNAKGSDTDEDILAGVVKWGELRSQRWC